MWDFNYITWFEFNASNSGLDLSTWFGDFQIPARTFVLIAFAVVALRIRKNLIAKNKKRKTVKK